MERQISELKAAWTRGHGVGPLEFSDVASGLNLHRRGLNAMLRAACEGKITKIVIAHMGRLLGRIAVLQ